MSNVILKTFKAFKTFNISRIVKNCYSFSNISFNSNRKLSISISNSNDLKEKKIKDKNQVRILF